MFGITLVFIFLATLALSQYAENPSQSLRTPTVQRYKADLGDINSLTEMKPDLLDFMPQTYYRSKEGFYYHGSVIIGTDKDFNKITEHFEYVFLYFWKPRCGWCRRLDPEFAKAAQKMAQTNSNVALIKIEAPNNPETTNRYKALKYPTLVLQNSKTGKKVYFWSLRKADNIVRWIEKQIEDSQKKSGKTVVKS